MVAGQAAEIKSLTLAEARKRAIYEWLLTRPDAAAHLDAEAYGELAENGFTRTQVDSALNELAVEKKVFLSPVCGCVRVETEETPL